MQNFMGKTDPIWVICTKYYLYCNDVCVHLESQCGVVDSDRRYLSSDPCLSMKAHWVGGGLVETPVKYLAYLEYPIGVTRGWMQLEGT